MIDQVPEIEKGRRVRGDSRQVRDNIGAHPSWVERLDAARRLTPDKLESTTSESTQYFDTWSRLIDPAQLGNFERRLAWDGLSIAQATAMLSKVDELDEPSPDRVGHPDWINQLEHLQAGLPGVAIPFDEFVGETSIPFYHLLAPILTPTCTQLLGSLASQVLTNISPQAHVQLTNVLISRISRMCSKTLLAAAGQQSYEEFCVSNLADSLGSLLFRYPGLGRIFAIVTKQWELNTRSLLERISRDRDELLHEFAIPIRAMLNTVEWELSDPHRGGQGVARLEFELAGTTRSVIYKPKDLRIEARLSDFIELINAQISPQKSRKLTILAIGDTHGYAECLIHEPCEPSKLSMFYRNAGRLLATIHLVNGSDCHEENLIASGADLFLIDAETIFESEINDFLDQQPSEIDDIRVSVLKTGMLPSWRTFSEGSSLVDVSALGIPSIIEHHSARRGWVDINTDSMRIGELKTIATQSTSLPVPIGTENPLSSHYEDVVDGFIEVYDLTFNPDFRIEIQTAFESFRGVNRRIVLRNTSTYAILSQRALTPSAMADPLVRGFELDRLSRAWLLTQKRPPHWDILRAELIAMENYDIPYFEFPLGSIEINSPGGGIKGVISAEGIETALQSLSQCSPASRDWQVRLIRGSFAARESMNRTELVSTVESTARTSADIASHLIDIELQDGKGNPTWLVLETLENTEQYQLQSISMNLYSGRAGLAAFLVSESADKSFEFLTEKVTEVLRPIENIFTDAHTQPVHRMLRDQGLGISGAGGVLRIFEYLNRVGFPEHSHTDQIWNTFTGSITPTILKKDRVLDVIGGCAGSAGPLARRFQMVPEEQTREALQRIGNHLLNAATPEGNWVTPTSKRALNGLAHGASGIGIALMEIGIALGNEEFTDAGVLALASETSSFDSESGNWLDLRDDSAPGSCMTGWCAGAPGIALTRMRAIELLPTHPDAASWSEQLDIAATTTATTPLRPLDSLCCGNLGRALIVSYVGDSSGNVSWNAASLEMLEKIETRAERANGFRITAFGSPDLQAPSLYKGLAGVGFALNQIKGSRADRMAARHLFI